MLYWTLLALLLTLPTPGHAQRFVDPETEEMLVDAVEAAVELDLFHARCRSDRSNRRTENLNKTIASKYRLTVIGVMDELFPERSYREAQDRLQREFAVWLREAGGCQGARESGASEALADRYQRLYAQIEESP